MTVVAIIGLLAAIAIPKFADLIVKSKESSMKGRLGAMRSAITIYYSDTEGTFPIDKLSCLTLNKKYLDEIPLVEVPSRHTATRNVKNNDDFGLNAYRTMDPGEWFYWNWTTPSTWDPIVQGNVWIGCTHRDSKDQPWSSF